MRTVTFKSLSNTNYSLAPHLLSALSFPTEENKPLGEFLDRPLKKSDNGVEVGSDNYTRLSPYFFVRAKSLQSENFLLDLSSDSYVSILPSAYKEYNLKKGDLLISKDSNIGESVLLEKDYPNYMISGAIYRLPISNYKHYVFAFLKSDIFKNQLDALVPKGATIRHAKKLFLDCKIPLPAQSNKKEIIDCVEQLVKIIVQKETEIKVKIQRVNSIIESELHGNGKDISTCSKPSYEEIINLKRLDTGLYTDEFKKIDSLIKNYHRGFFNLEKNKIKSGSTPKKRIIGFNDNFKYRWITPTHISDFGTLFYDEKIQCIANNLNEKSMLLINRTSKGGRGEYVGIAMFYDPNVKGKAHHNQGIYRISGYTEHELKFMTCFMNSTLMRKYCSGLSVGSKMKEIKARQFLTIPFPNFPGDISATIVRLYSNGIKYPKCNGIRGVIAVDEKWTHAAGITELSDSIVYFKNKLIAILEKIADGSPIDPENI